MIAVIQRVTQAEIIVTDNVIGKIDTGIVALIAVEKADTKNQVEQLARRILNYRIFADVDGKMNLNIADIGGKLMLVPQFTLAADTNKGNRPSFSPSAPPDKGRALFKYMVQIVKDQYPGVALGQFGSDMQVSLTNDGPVTFILRASPD